jgi:hypothetical protein
VARFGTRVRHSIVQIGVSATGVQKRSRTDERYGRFVGGWVEPNSGARGSQSRSPPLTAAGGHQPRSSPLAPGGRRRLFRLPRDQPGPEFARYRMVEARVDDLQTHGVFHIHPAAHGLGSLAVRQALGTWQHCREGESLGCSSGLAALGNKRANS